MSEEDIIDSIFNLIIDESFNQIIEFIEEYHIDINSKNKRSETFLTEACYANNIDFVKYLVEAGIDINHQDEDGDSALMVCCMSGSLETLIYLLSLDADITLRNTDNITALDIAKEKGFGTIVSLIENKMKYKHRKKIVNTLLTK